MTASPTSTAVAQAAATLFTLLARQQAPGSDDTGASADSAAADGNDAADEDACASGNATDKWGLRIGAIFVILVCLESVLAVSHSGGKRRKDANTMERYAGAWRCVEGYLHYRSLPSLVQSPPSSCVVLRSYLVPYGNLQSFSVAVLVS